MNEVVIGLAVVAALLGVFYLAKRKKNKNTTGTPSNPRDPRDIDKIK